MERNSGFHVAICGAGIGGLGLALALNHRGIHCTVFEAAESIERVLGGSLQLGPHAQLILDEYGMTAALSRHSVFYDQVTIRDNKGNFLTDAIMGDKEVYGYACMRIIRKTLVAELAARASSRGIQVLLNKRVVGVVANPDTSLVELEFADGTRETSPLVVGADGIWSKVRRSLFANSLPSYTGSLGIGGSVEADKFVEPLSREGSGVREKLEGMYLGPHGAFMLMPQVPDKSEYLVALQKPHPDMGRAAWTDMRQDVGAITELFDKNKGDWPMFAQRALGGIKHETTWVWPVHDLKRLENWISGDGRIVLIGDAAHAMPPASAQGANMALEDGYLLALALSTISNRVTLKTAVNTWQQVRMARIDTIKEFNTRWQAARTPGSGTEAAQKVNNLGASAEAGSEQLRWLFDGVTPQVAELGRKLSA